MVMRHGLLVLALFAGGACSRANDDPGRLTTQRAAPAGLGADSIVLERTLSMPGDLGVAYRLRIDRQGGVHVRMRRPAEQAVVVTDSVPAAAFTSLIAEASRIGFYQIPELVKASRAYCPIYATDHPTVTTTIFHPDGSKRVEHYTGCYRRDYTRDMPLSERSVPELIPLSRFHAAIDSVGRIANWLPSRRH